MPAPVPPGARPGRPRTGAVWQSDRSLCRLSAARAILARRPACGADGGPVRRQAHRHNRAERETDFLDRVAGFRTLLGRTWAKVLELDGARGDKETQNRSYEAVERMVVRNCDLLIAIWDGGKGRAAAALPKLSITPRTMSNLFGG